MYVCVKCKKSPTKVLETRSHGSDSSRLRQCVACGHKFLTIEKVLVADYVKDNPRGRPKYGKDPKTIFRKSAPKRDTERAKLRRLARTMAPELGMTPEALCIEWGVPSYRGKRRVVT